MRHFCLVSVLSAVDNGQLTLCLERHHGARAGNRAQHCCKWQAPTPTRLSTTNKTTHLKCSCPFTCTLHFILLSDGPFLWGYSAPDYFFFTLVALVHV